MKNVIKIFFASVLIILNVSIVSFANEGMAAVKYTDKEQVYLYIGEDGHSITNQWKQVWDNWYYFGEDGASKQNTWAQIDGNWYYFNEYSIMLTDTTTPDGYYVGSGGAWTTKSEDSIDTSIWLGSYSGDDGQIITVRSVNSGSVNITFEGYSEEGSYKQDYVLKFSNEDKTQAIFENEQLKEKDVYTLTENGMKVSVKPYGGWKQGTYVRR